MKIIERIEDIARNEQCLLFPRCFSLYRIDKLPAILPSSEIVDSKLFYFRESKHFAWRWLIVRIIRDRTELSNYYMTSNRRRSN